MNVCLDLTGISYAKLVKWDLLKFVVNNGGIYNMSVMPINIGQYRKKMVSVDMENALNKHIAILGKPGGGKSVEAQKILIELAQQGSTVIVLDMHSVADATQIFPAYREKFMKLSHEIDSYHDGICCELFSPVLFPDGECEKRIDTVGAIVDMLSRTKRLGSKQHSTLRLAVQHVMERGSYQIKGFEAVDAALEMIGTEVAETVREKLYPLTAHNVFRPGKLFIEAGMINIIRLSKYDLETQETIAEVILSYLWRLATTLEFSKKGLFIFVDECQNLPSGKGCALGQILAEGRKFNVNVILATQQMELNSNSVVQQRLMQSGLILFFQPNTAQISMVAKVIEPANADAWSLTLKSLGKGEFVAIGSLLVDGVPMEKPLKISSKVAEDYENT